MHKAGGLHPRTRRIARIAASPGSFGHGRCTVATPVSRAKSLSWAGSGITLQAFTNRLPCLHRGRLRVSAERTGPLPQSATSACIHQSLTHEALLAGHTRMKWLESGHWALLAPSTPGHPCRIGYGTLSQPGLGCSEFHCQPGKPSSGSRRRLPGQTRSQMSNPREFGIGKPPSAG